MNLSGRRGGGKAKRNGSVTDSAGQNIHINLC